MQETYFMIKPEIVAAADQKVGAILAQVNASGFRIRNLALRRLDRDLVGQFYAEHQGKPFFDSLVEYITSGPVICVHLERENAVAALRELIGATNPANAATGTVRALYGTSLGENAVHASANPDDAARELALIFGS
ncbi:MAG: nucleoside-diphosphate kinase [Candidatus Krumholzibacteriia bacterium]